MHVRDYGCGRGRVEQMSFQRIAG
ncbi:MAG: hypothetical protein RIS45_962, partial [Planctomycetota bacterium]